MFTALLIFAILVVAVAVIADRFVENSMGTKRFYAKDNPTTESKPYRDPHLYNDKTGKRSYRVREMRYENHTKFQVDYYINGDDRWLPFNEQKNVEDYLGGKRLMWMPVEFTTLTDAWNYCEEDKKKLRNETLLETITHIV